VDEARIVEGETGQVVDGAGWFILNLADAGWERREGFGARCRLEPSDHRFSHLGVNVRLLEPGQPSALYHGEETQEGFLVLAGECLAVVEGQERRLRRWDYLHCPPMTRHVLVGAGEGACAILMLGAPRSFTLDEMEYPADQVAQRYGAAVTRTTRSSKEAYADRRAAPTSIRAPWPPSR
jgi:uncharacterized cupin superfamily protein